MSELDSGLLNVTTPAAELLGRKVLDVDAATRVVRVSYEARPDFLNRHGTVQGGLLAAMLDSATALALFAQLEPKFTAVTQQLQVVFLHPAALGSFVAVARLIERNARIARTEASLYDAQEQLIASATATLRILKR